MACRQSAGFSTLSAPCRERERVLAASMAPPVLPAVKADMPRFTGGGFNLKQAQKALV